MTELEIVQEIGRDTCRCGGLKKRGHTFCRECYANLPVDLQRGLYARLGAGYMEAREAAAKYLAGERCGHIRLNEEGLCRECGADRSGV